MLQFPENIYNVYFLARQREYSLSSCLLSRIMRSLCCRSQRSYKHVFSLKSKQPIYQCLNLIYMKNYSSSYNGWGIQLWKDVHKEKVTDALFSYGHWDKDPINRIAHKSSILGISQKHKLVRLCAETGTVLESIFLSQIYKFKNIYWDDPHYTAVISSSKVQTQDQSNCPGSMMKAIALFNVFPLEFVGMFAIEKEIFGNDLHDALVSDNLLVTNKRGGIVELFSVDYILEHFLLYKASLYEPDPVTGHIVGMHPFGIPFNIKFKALPPVLLRIKTEDHDVQFGGFPYHMILAAPSQYGVFYIKTLYDEETIQNGRLDLGNGHSVDTDTAIFHPDRPSKILHYGGTRVRVLSMADDGYSNKCIQLQKEISSTRNSMICASRETITRSGRQIKPTSTNIQQYERKVEEIFYDSELDIFAVLTKDHNDFFSCPPNACLEIYDNETCTYLRSIDVDIPDNAPSSGLYYKKKQNNNKLKWLLIYQPDQCISATRYDVTAANILYVSVTTE